MCIKYITCSTPHSYIGLLEIRQEVRANRILLEKIVSALSTKEFSSDLIYELDQDFAFFPLNSMEDFDELEKKFKDPSAQEQLV